MRYLFLALVSASLAALSNAYTQPVGANPSGNPISKPGLGEIVPAGQPYTITWNPTTTGTVTLVLLQGPSTNVVPLYAIVQGIPNTGSYVWTPSTSLQADTTHYGIQLIVDATGQYQYSTQFGISNSGVVSSSSSASSSSSSMGYTIPVPMSSAPYIYNYNTSNSTSTKYTIPASTGGLPSTIVSPTAPMTVPSTLLPTSTPTKATGAPAATGAAAAAHAAAAAPALIPLLAGMAALLL